MSTEIVRDRYNTIIGYIETTPMKVIGRDKNRRIVGFYRSSDDYTRDHMEKIVGRGNQLVALIHRVRQ